MIALAAFVLGLIVGTGVGGDTVEPDDTTTASPGPTDQATLEREIRASLADEYEAKELELERRSEALDRREAELTERAAALEEQEKRVSQQKSEPDPAPEPEPEPEPEPAPEPESVYYKNCDAVRAAGQAPLRRGDPGYASHLDRDGDGVACE